MHYGTIRYEYTSQFCAKYRDFEQIRVILRDLVPNYANTNAKYSKIMNKNWWRGQ